MMKRYPNQTPVRRQRKTLEAALIVALALLLVGCQNAKQPQEPTKGDLYVYVASPLSGFQANGGQTVLGGVNLMAAELNRTGGLLGYKVVVVPKDDESDSDVALAVAEQVRADIAAGKRVLGLIGHYNSGQTLAAMEVYKKGTAISFASTPTTRSRPTR
jgi:branched-chain amino acid transport system substrate-binding protein